MSVGSLAALFDILKVKRTELVGDLKATVAAYFKTPDPLPADEIGQDANADESGAADWWQHYGFASRPPADAEAFVVRMGATVIAIASRALAAAKVFGQLADGDVAIYSIGGNVIRLNKDGSISAMMTPESGKPVVIQLGKKGNGSVKAFLSGAKMCLELGEENGFYVNAGAKDITFRCGGQFQVCSNGFVNNSPTLKTTATASLPLLGGAASQPAPGVFV